MIIISQINIFLYFCDRMTEQSNNNPKSTGNMKRGWEYKKLGEVCEILNGFAFKSNKYVKQGIRVMRITNVQKGLIVDDDPKFYPFDEESSIKQYLLNKGDLLMSLTGNVGRVGLLQQSFLPAALNQRVACLRLSISKLQLEYLFHFLNSERFEKDCVFNASGIAQKNLSTEWLKKYIIPVPPLSEQQRIVEELDLLSSIIEKKKAQLKELDSLAQSIFYDMFGDNNYEIVTLGEVVEIKSTLVSPTDLPYSEMLHVSPSNIISNVGSIVDCVKAKEESLISGKYTFSKGMILYSKIRPNLNKVAIPNFDGICSADMYPLSIKGKVNSIFIWRLLLSKGFLEYAIKHSGRARMPKLNREALFAYRFPLPPLPLQQQFAEKVEAIEHQKELIKQSIKEVETLFNSRMDYYFDG